MSHAAARSQVRERKDVDLVLGQGMLAPGWQSDTLDAPGKFLVSAPEHTTPSRARAYVITDQANADTVVRYAGGGPNWMRRPARDHRGGRHRQLQRRRCRCGDRSR